VIGAEEHRSACTAGELVLGQGAVLTWKARARTKRLMQPIDRRTALTLGGLGLLSTALGGCGLFWRRPPSALDALTGGGPSRTGGTAKSGRLRSALRLEAAALGPVRLPAGKQPRSATAAGCPARPLRVRPGRKLPTDLPA